MEEDTIVGTNTDCYFVVWQVRNEYSSKFNQWFVTRQPDGRIMNNGYKSKDSAIGKARWLYDKSRREHHAD